jgi:ABC-2 type transport system permease protein
MAGGNIRNMFGFGGLLLNLVYRDLTVRYKRSVIGFMWTLLNPVIMTAVYTMVFSTVFRFPTQDFIVYFLSAYLIWHFFAQCTVEASKCILNAGALVKKIYIPKIALVLSVVISGIINFGFALIPLIFVVLIFGGGFSISILFLITPVIFVVVFTIGVSLILASLTVFFLDVGEFYNALLMPWMFLTPIMYPMDIIPKKYLFLIKLNPMYYLVECFRIPIYQGTIPNISMIAIGALVAIASLVIGYIVFTRTEDDFVYYV